MNLETRPFNALLEYLKHDKTLENRFVHTEKKQISIQTSITD